ncbi:hypothetical protein FRC05_010208 [Tulasnella sp. 425]|nr:hypothetical protein FRC05_010208 [Tulasnella sp. 425]
MSYSKIAIKAKATVTGSRTPTSFVRKYTHINFTHIASSKPSKFAIWKACHAVLNASVDGCLTTQELENAIRLQYPTNSFVLNTLNHTLSQSDDFSQVFLQGRARGHWFLTGKTRGVEKAAAKKARKLAEAASMSSTNSNDADNLPINQLPYPIKMEGNSPAPTLPSLTPLTPPLPSRARTTRSPPPRSVRGVNLSEAVARPSGAYRPYVPPSAVQALVGLGQSIHLDVGSQFNDIPPLEIPSFATSINSSSEELSAMRDALQGPPLPPPMQVPPQDLLPKDDVYSNMPPSPDPTQAIFDFIIFDPPFPQGADPLVPDVSYHGDLGVNTVAPQSFDSSIPQAPPQEELLKGHDFWKLPEENVFKTALKLMPCGTAIAQEDLPVAYHTVDCVTCTAATPHEDLGWYQSLVAADVIHYTIPELPKPRSEQLQATEPEVPTAGLRFDASFDLLGRETHFWM